MSHNGIYCPMSDFLTRTHTDTTKPLIDRQKRSRGVCFLFDDLYPTVVKLHNLQDICL